MRKLRLGVIGCGNIKKKHIQAIFLNRDKIALASVCDLYAERARDFRDSYLALTGDGENISIYTDYLQMLRKEKLDMASILTDSGKHYTIASDCMERGINVLVEKPLALSLDEVDSLTRTASVNKVKLGVVHQYRFNPLISGLKHCIDTGRLGRLFYGVTTVRWNRNREYYTKSKWRGTKHLDGGVLMNQCIQNVDILQWLLGEKAAEVYAYKQNYAHPYIDTEDTVLALIKFGSGMLGMVEGTVSIFSGNLENSIAVFGEKGSVKIGGKALNRIDVWDLEGCDSGAACAASGDKLSLIQSSGCHGYVYKDFINKLESREEPAINGNEARKSIEIVLAIQQSAELGLPVNLPLKGGTNNWE